MKAQGKVIVVTGAGGGIGRELVLQLVSKGASVAAADINPQLLEQTLKACGEHKEKVSTHVINIADAEKTRILANDVFSIYGGVDGLINNAGIIQPFVKVDQLDDATIQRVMNVNFYGMLNMTRAFLPHLLKRPDAHIVNISSMGGLLPVPGQTIYGAAKAAVKLFTEGLYCELIGTPVHVTVIFPGAINTNITANSGVEFKQPTDTSKSSNIKMLSAEEAARQIILAMEKNKYRACVGNDSSFLDKLYRVAPGFAARFITKQMKSLLK